jgi:HK97 family phage major capsid protein
LPLNRFSFDGYNSLKIPMRNAAASPNLAGAFRAEGAPIRVGALSLGSMTLTPKSLGVIGTFSMELFERSTPNIEQVIREAMVSDTAAALDAAFLGNAAGTATVPAGILNGLAGGNTAASAGTTSANIVTDLRARMQAMAAANMGRRPVWIMNPARAWGLQLALTAAGTPLFPEMANGTLLGIPVVTSTTVTAGSVFLIDCAEVFFAGGAPSFLGTDVATIHEEDTTPAQISTAGTPNVVAAPVRSLFQTNSAALRCMWNVDWAVARAGAVQHISAAAW